MCLVHCRQSLATNYSAVEEGWHSWATFGHSLLLELDGAIGTVVLGGLVGDKIVALVPE